MHRSLAPYFKIRIVIRRKANRFLSADLRALAALRVGLALLVIWDLAVRASDLSCHYSDTGILPRAARILIFDMDGETGIQNWWSLHLISGALWFQAALFVAASLFALQLLVGYRTRLATILTWVFLASVQARLPMMLQGGDSLLRLLLFWGMFLPLGAVWSVDQCATCITSTLRPKLYRYSSIATAALILQIAIMYLCNAIAKHSPVWHTDHTAIYYVLSLDIYVTRIGKLLLEYSGLMSLFTATTLWLEWLVPFALFSPWKTGFVRVILIVLFWCFHAGLAICLNVGLLSYVAMVAWLVFLPTGFWDAAERIVRRKLTHWPVPAFLKLRTLYRPQQVLSKPLGLLSSTFIGLALSYVVAWNAMLIHSNQVVTWPAWLCTPGQILRLEQQWVMFAPVPMTDDGWFVLRGTLMDGSEVNLWEPSQPLSYEKPRHGADFFPNHRWRKYFVNFISHPDARLLSCLADWLARKWNEGQAKGDPEKVIRTVQILIMTDLTSPPGEMPEPHQALELWHWDYENAEPVPWQSIKPTSAILPVDLIRRISLKASRCSRFPI